MQLFYTKCSRSLSVLTSQLHRIGPLFDRLLFPYLVNELFCVYELELSLIFPNAQPIALQYSDIKPDHTPPHYLYEISLDS